MIKKIGFAIVCLTITGLYAQNGTVSPYSYFGIGDMRSSGSVENQMMGGIGVFADSIHINLRNPAAYSKLGIKNGEDFGITTYSAGLSRKEITFKSFTDKQSSSIAALDYLAIAFSARKGLGLGFGVMPFSSVGYNVLSQDTNNENAQVTNQYTGEGGLNRVYFTVGYEFMKNVSFGVTTNFNFGTIESRRVQSIENVQYGALDERSSKVNGLDFNFGLNYTPIIKGNHRLFASVRVNTQANLTSENTKRVGSFSLVNGQDVEVIDVALENQGLRNTDLKIPATTTLGLGYGEDRKWFLGAEYSSQGLSSFSNAFLGVENLVYKDASTYAIGGYFIPDYTAFSGYLKKVTYRAGLRFSKTGMVINNKDINDFGITFGLGLPLRGSFSNINLGFELGKRGTSANDLVEESYFKVNVGLSLNDLWFQKRKIN